MKRTQCPQCIDTGQDNLVEHENGSVYCYACGYNPKKSFMPKTTLETIEPGSIRELTPRRLSKSTCEKYGVTATRYTGGLGKQRVTDHPVVVFNRFSNGQLKGQKIRDIKDRSLCTQRGENDSRLFGVHAFHPNNKYFVVVTEGEFDAMSVFESTHYAAVSITHGAQSAKKDVQANLEWLMAWQYVVLCFDNDDAGRQAAQQCVTLFEPGKVRVCFLPLKDANEMLMAGRGAELKTYLWQAQENLPNDLVTAGDIVDRILDQPTMGPSWPWESLTQITYGMQSGRITVIAGGTGIGKTEIVKELVLHSVYTNNIHCALFSFEQSAADAYRRLIGGRLQIPMHIPGNMPDESLVRAEIERLADKVYVFDRQASAEELLTFDSLVNKIKVLAKAKDVKLFVIDNLKAISATLADPIRGIEQCMVRLQSVANAYAISFIIISHLAKDKKRTEAGSTDESWTTGRMPVLENIYGSSAIEAIADTVLALARNVEDEDILLRNTTIVKCLKNRIDGSKCGKTFTLTYDKRTSRLVGH